MRTLVTLIFLSVSSLPTHVVAQQLRVDQQAECSAALLLKGKSFEAFPKTTATGASARRAFEANRLRWVANRVPYYRLCVATFNPLRITVTQSDVRNRLVVIARQAAGDLGLEPRRDSATWAPSDGHTVEALFEQIQSALRMPESTPSGRTIPYEVHAWYDPRKGYPIRIDYGPAQGVAAYDAHVSTRVRLTESPTAPLNPPSPAEAYATPKRARIVNTGIVYDALFVVDSRAINVRRVWPQRADEIVRRGSSPYWRSVGWEPQPGVTGDVIGTFKHPDGQLLYLLEVRHRNSTLFYPPATVGVELID